MILHLVLCVRLKIYFDLFWFTINGRPDLLSFFLLFLFTTFPLFNFPAAMIIIFVRISVIQVLNRQIF